MESTNANRLKKVLLWADMFSLLYLEVVLSSARCLRGKQKLSGSSSAFSPPNRLVKSMAERCKVPDRARTDMKESRRNDFASEIFAIKTTCFMLNLLRFLKLKSESEAGKGAC